MIRKHFAPWNRPGLAAAFDIEQTASRIGHYAWLEMKLFEAMGRWTASVPEADVKLLLGTHTYHHAWHGEQFQNRLPEVEIVHTIAGGISTSPDRPSDPSADLETTSPRWMAASPNAALDAFVTALNEPDSPEKTIEKLVGIYRVLIPHKIAAYTYHLHNTSTIADGPTIRTLDFVLRDEHSDWLQGEMMLQSLIATPEDVRRAADHQAKLETLIVEAGGIVGPGTLGASSPES